MNWISTKEQMPPDDVDVLIFDGFDYRIASCHKYGTTYEWIDRWDFDYRNETPKFWCPLEKPNT